MQYENSEEHRLLHVFIYKAILAYGASYVELNHKESSG